MIELDRRGIEVVADDLGRLAVSRDDARTLIAEQRENERRARAAAAEAERQAIERDQRRLAAVWTGVPAVDLPYGVSAAGAMLAADKAARPRRQSVLEESLSNSGTFTYHPIQSGGNES
jgi:hypothetical protein